MKKSVLFAAALFTVTAVSAQTGEITSAKGENWLSQDGDWGLTFDAQPLLNYAGNLFNNGTNTNTVSLNSPWGTGTSGIVIGGKKLIDANTAYRGRVRIGFGSTKETEQVDAVSQSNPPSDPLAQVDNVTKTGYFGLTLGAGMEKRVGSTRVVGVYGADFNVSLGSGKTTFEYGDALSNDNQNGGQYRNTEIKNASSFGLGLNAFAGVEWFAAPKLSIGGEYTWGLALTSSGLMETAQERWDASANNGTGAQVTRTIEGNDTPDGEGNNPADKTSNFSLDTGVSGGRILVNFYFQ